MNPRSLLVLLVLSIAGWPANAASAPPQSALPTLRAQFHDYSGATLVFERSALPGGRWYERMPRLSSRRRVAAARIALAEVRKLPRGYLGAIGLERVGVFAALVSSRSDGFRQHDAELGGYPYFGLSNGQNSVIAAYYSDGQLPLTLHHEIFHHVDATHGGTTHHGRHFAADDARFRAALKLERPYAAPRMSKADRAALKRRSRGVVLQNAVGRYASKNAGEDQAETARHLMSQLPDAMLQVVERPTLPGSQRILHVLAQYNAAASMGATHAWFVNRALGRPHRLTRAEARRDLQAGFAALRKRIQPRGDDTTFTVWGGPDARGRNWTLRADLKRFGRDAADDARRAQQAPGGEAMVTAALLRRVRLVARYERYVGRRWSLTRGTRSTFVAARERMIAALPASRTRLKRRLRAADLEGLAEGISKRGVVSARLERPNPHIAKVDGEIADRLWRARIRAVQPAAVRLSNGSGVNIDSFGTVLTNAHVAKKKGVTLDVRFPDGRRFQATCTAIDRKLDLAVLRIAKASQALPVAAIAARAPKTGSRVAVIGQPGSFTPNGGRTGYEPFHVSTGEIRGFRSGSRLANQQLGSVKHDAWTYWGHSGSPLFNEHGAVVALHNSWDSTTAMRHAIPHEAILDFLRREKVRFRSR